MGFFDFFRAKGGPSEPTPQLHFEERDWDTESESSGEELHGRGYALRDERDHALTWHDPVLAAAGAMVVKVAGTSHRLRDVQSDSFAPGSQLLLRPEPGNEHDRYAVSVWDKAGRVQVGWVPKEHSREVTARLGGETLEAMSLWEWRDQRAERCGLRMLIYPPSALAERPPPLTQ